MIKLRRLSAFVKLLSVAVLITAVFVACTAESEPPDYTSYDEQPVRIVGIYFVTHAIQNPAEWVVIDVRTPEEFNGDSRLPNAFGTGRIKGAVNVDRELVFDASGEILDEESLMELYYFIGDRHVIVYCHGGVRSDFIMGILLDLGFHVFNYEGSWIDWSRAASTGYGTVNELVLSLTENWVDNGGVIQ